MRRKSVIVKANAVSSNQDSGSSNDDGSIPADVIHQGFFKPKSAPEPLIDQKAKAMMAKMGFREGAGLVI